MFDQMEHIISYAFRETSRCGGGVGSQTPSNLLPYFIIHRKSLFVINGGGEKAHSG